MQYSTIVINSGIKDYRLNLALIFTGIRSANLMKEKILSQAWWYKPKISAIGRLKKEDHEFEASLSNMMRPHLKKKKVIEGYDRCFGLSHCFLVIFSLK